MSNTDKSVLRRAVDYESSLVVKSSLDAGEYNSIGIPYSVSGMSLHRYAEGLAAEVDLILYPRAINKTFSQEEKEVLRQHREAQIILDRLGRDHVPTWQWISIIFSLVVGVLFIYLVFEPLPNIWLGILSASFALLLLLAPLIGLMVFYAR